MKPFNLKEAKAGKAVCTRNGKRARIICFGVRSNNFPIVALIDQDECEVPYSYTNNGSYYDTLIEHRLDLFMAPKKHEGWVNVYKNNVVDPNIYKTKEKALSFREPLFSNRYITTTKIEWEE